PEKRSLLQRYTFDPSQECKLSAGERCYVAFTHSKEHKFNVFAIDLKAGELTLKAGPKVLEHFGGSFPQHGCLIPDEYVNPDPIPAGLTAVAESHLTGDLNRAARALLERHPPKGLDEDSHKTLIDKATAIALQMDGDCLVIQGPPGTGKTYTASHMIASLIAAGKKVGITSNGHKAVVNLMCACGNAVHDRGGELTGMKVGGDDEGELFDRNPCIGHVGTPKEAAEIYERGVIGGTAWLFSRDEMVGRLDYLFVDEAGQVSLANVVAMSRSTKNLVLLGDQMQLEQPIQGSHPGEARLSALHYALKDTDRSSDDVFLFHAVIPSSQGLFLGETRRMHPSVCEFISESIYEGRLHSFGDCSKQSIDCTAAGYPAHGIVFCPVEHDGNIQQSDEEVERVREVFNSLIGRECTGSDAKTAKLALEDFLFITPYNAQVRALEAALPTGARVGSVDKFQGQEAPVCILSLCSSAGEYGSRGLGFILDQNRINVAISRAKCLAVVVADPRIAETAARSLETMKLLNLFCKLLPFATKKAAH
ncbi:MAG: AAA family ATPase, partial [Acidobacteria bacterium]|nr:AAA family ATPase [Acidobacteriota bacterium]